ncbi:unnamed protein product [Cochlearia groenlandica]
MVERLVDRKTESREELLVRFARAREEVRHVNSFDYVVVNAKGNLDDAVKRVESIIDAEKSKVHQRIVKICDDVRNSEAASLKLHIIMALRPSVKYIYRD